MRDELEEEISRSQSEDVLQVLEKYLLWTQLPVAKKVPTLLYAKSFEHFNYRLTREAQKRRESWIDKFSYVMPKLYLYN